MVHVPQNWFNAYPTTIRENQTPNEHKYALGGLQIHFEANRDGKRLEKMNTWMNISEQDTAPYNAGPNDSGFNDDISKFWKESNEERSQQGARVSPNLFETLFHSIPSLNSER